MLWKAGFLPIRIRGQSVQIRLNQSLQYTSLQLHVKILLLSGFVEVFKIALKVKLQALHLEAIST